MACGVRKPSRRHEPVARSSRRQEAASAAPLPSGSCTGYRTKSMRSASLAGISLIARSYQPAASKVEEQNPAADEREAGDLLQAEGLAPKVMHDEGDDRVPDRDAGVSDRDRDLLDRRYVEEGREPVAGEADDRVRIEELRDDVGRASRPGLQH